MGAAVRMDRGSDGRRADAKAFAALFLRMVPNSLQNFYRSRPYPKQLVLVTITCHGCYSCLGASPVEDRTAFSINLLAVHS
jgi:hypothetical protein